MKYLLVAAVLGVFLVGVFATAAITRSPDVSTSIPNITEPTSNATTPHSESDSLPFNTILYYYASGPVGRYMFPSLMCVPVNASCVPFLGTSNIPAINDQQTWIAFWNNVSSSPAPEMDFDERTVLLVSFPISQIPPETFNLTQAFLSEDHVQFEGVVTGPGPGCAYIAIVLPPIYPVVVVDIPKTELPAFLTVTFVDGPGCSNTADPGSTSAGMGCTPFFYATVNIAVTCSVTILNNSPDDAIGPTGTFFLSSNSTGSFDGPCTLSAAVSGTTPSAGCTVTYIPSVPGLHRITANYPGDSAHTGCRIEFDIFVRDGTSVCDCTK